jgi:hypothetical protein
MIKKMSALLMSGAFLMILAAGCGKEEEKTAASGDAIGVAECDDYLKKVESCMGKMPAEGKAAMESAMKTNRDAWKEAAKNTAGKDALKTGCKAALDAFTSANPTCK